LTGLIIGSLTPDFEYFIRMRIKSNYSHSLGGLFWFDLPLGLLAAFIFHYIIRDNLFDNLPTVLRSRFSKYYQFNWYKYFINNWYVVIISLLIGAASHLLWDSFTHKNGYLVNTIAVLTSKFEIINRQISIYQILQHASTIIGLLLIIFFIFRLPSDKNVKGKFNAIFWSILIVLTLIIVAIRILCGLKYEQYGHTIATIVSAGLISLIFVSLGTSIIKLFQRIWLHLKK